MAPTLSPTPRGPEDQPYEYVAWPAWFYGPDGQSAIFQNAEEIPDGWVDYDRMNGGHFVILEQNNEPAGAEIKRELTDDQRTNALNKLIDGNTQTALVAMLEAMQAVDESIQFLPGWPKPKLAATIVDNGGPIED